MDKIKLLQTRRSKVLEAGSEIRKTISELVDADSFVELSGYSFSKNEFYGEDAEGEGVVTGFATVEGYPVYDARRLYSQQPRRSSRRRRHRSRRACLRFG